MNSRMSKVLSLSVLEGWDRKSFINLLLVEMPLELAPRELLVGSSDLVLYPVNSIDRSEFT